VGRDRAGYACGANRYLLEYQTQRTQARVHWILTPGGAMAREGAHGPLPAVGLGPRLTPPQVEAMGLIPRMTLWP